MGTKPPACRFWLCS